MTHHLTAEHITDEMRECISRCSDCHNVCLETVTHSITTGGDQAAVEHVRLLLDCADICATSRDFMLRGSESHPHTCGLCAEVCRRYVDWAEAHSHTDEQMRNCAQACRACAESCESMSA